MRIFFWCNFGLRTQPFETILFFKSVKNSLPESNNNLSNINLVLQKCYSYRVRSVNRFESKNSNLIFEVKLCPPPQICELWSERIGKSICGFGGRKHVYHIRCRCVLQIFLDHFLTLSQRQILIHSRSKDVVLNYNRLTIVSICIACCLFL